MLLTDKAQIRDTGVWVLTLFASTPNMLLTAAKALPAARICRIMPNGSRPTTADRVRTRTTQAA